MSLELGVVSRNAEKHKKKYEFFSDLAKLMEEKPEFVQQLQEYLAAKGRTQNRGSATRDQRHYEN